MLKLHNPYADLLALKLMAHLLLTSGKPLWCLRHLESRKDLNRSICKQLNHRPLRHFHYRAGCIEPDLLRYGLNHL